MQPSTPRPGARAAIIAAATELIRSNGVAGTAISDVIARSGTSAGAIYHHFGSKERLVLEVGRSVVAGPMAMILQTTTGLSPSDLFAAALAQVGRDEQTPELLLQIWAGAKADPALYRLLQTEGTVLKEGVRTYLQHWCDVHAPDADARALVDLIMGLVMGFAAQRALTFTVDVDGYRTLGMQVIAAAVDQRVAV